MRDECAGVDASAREHRDGGLEIIARVGDGEADLEFLQQRGEGEEGIGLFAGAHRDDAGAPRCGRDALRQQTGRPHALEDHVRRPARHVGELRAQILRRVDDRVRAEAHRERLALRRELAQHHVPRAERTRPEEHREPDRARARHQHARAGL